MVRVLFDPESVEWEDFLESQQGGAYYFEGVPYQRGYGIGSVFSNLLRYLIPIGKAVGRELGKEGLATGTRILNELSSGQDLKTAVKSETRQGLKNLVDKAYEGSGKKGIKRSATKKKSITNSKIGPVKRSDYLGSY